VLAAATPTRGAHTPATKSGKKARRSLLLIKPAITKETPSKRQRKRNKKAKQQAVGESCRGQGFKAAAGIATPSASSNRVPGAVKPATNKAKPDNTVPSSSPLHTPSKPSSSRKRSMKSKSASKQAGNSLSLLCAESNCSEQLLLLCGSIGASGVSPLATRASLPQMQVTATAVQQESSASRVSVWDRLAGGRDKWLPLQLADDGY
jgi:hypothetical protein